MNQLKFSIVIPTYNRAPLLLRTLESVVKIDYPDFEVLVIDDGGNDDSEERINRLADPRIHYFKKANGERGAARNYGAAKAVGKYINFFDSDDLVYPHHLNAAASLVLESKCPEWFHLGYDHRIETGEILGVSDKFDDQLGTEILFNNLLSCNGVFLRADIAREFPFEENRTLASSEDWELWIKLVCRFPLRYSNVVTSSVIQHGQRSLVTIRAEKVVSRDRLLIEKLSADPVIMARYGNSFRRFISERYTFFMLCFAEEHRLSEVWKWGSAAFAIYPRVVLTRRFLAAFKNGILQ